MRLFLIISEHRFVKPKFLEKLIKKRRKDIIGIAIISARSPKFSFFKFAKRQLDLFGFYDLSILAIKNIYYIFLDKLSKFVNLPRCYSSLSVVKKYKIPLYQPEDVNSPEFLEKLRNLEPDIVLSSCAQIFKKELLNLPKITCINRHTALLPQYGGLWPVFWAMLNDEEKIGATIHKMVEKIDEGEIITQGIIDHSKKESMFSIYEKGMDLSLKLTLEALDIIENNKSYNVLNKNTKKSYYTFPTKKDAKLFRKKGYRFI